MIDALDFGYDELATEAVKILDKYNFKEALEAFKRMKILDPHDIREHLGNNYGILEYLEYLSLDEFMEYLSVRYGVKWTEIINYRMY